MSLYKFVFIIFIELIFYTVKAQTIKGTVLNQSKSPTLATILLKETSDKDLILEFFESDENGKFAIKPQKSYQYLFIEIRAMGYATIFDSIQSPQNKEYIFNFILKEEAIELQEFVVKTQKTVVVKKDTTEFYPNAFLNGTERKVEDLLKKLPGMEVSGDGKLKYNGKVVESVQLDGDDLFGGKYAIGTKNIPVDIVQKVQAINNFNANPLLKGIINSETVSLNLILKKGKGALNSEIRLGLGIDNENTFRNNNSLNVLSIKQKIKGFAFGSSNNIGHSNGSNDYFRTSYDFDDEIFETNKLLPYSNQNSALNSNLTNLNNEKTGSINSFIRFSPNITSKVNFNYSKDSKNKIENTLIEYPLEQIKYDDATNSNLLPKGWGIDTKIDILISKKGLLEIENNFSNQKINFFEQLIQNKNRSFLNVTNTTIFNQKNKLLYTVKIKEKSALQFLISNSTDNAPQFLNSISLKKFTQNSVFEKQLLKNEIKFISRNKLFNYQIIGGYFKNKTEFNSNFEDVELSNSLNTLKNKLTYFKENVFLQFKPNFDFYKFKFNPSFKLQQITQKHINKISLNVTKNSDRVFNANLNLLFEPISLHKINFNFKNDNESLNDQYLIENSVWNGNRDFQKSDLNLSLAKTKSYGFEYRYHEPFHLITIVLGASVNESSNTYLSRFVYDSLFTYTTNFRLPIVLKTKNYQLGLEKFLKIISAKYSLNYSDNNYKNLVNNSEMRNNKIKSLANNLFIKSSFSNKFGFENTLNLNKSRIFSDNNFLFEFSSLDFYNKIYYRTEKQFEIIANIQSINPNIQSNKYYNFSDLEILVKPKKKSKFSNVNFQFKNILNTKFYTEFSNNDFSKTFYSSNLLPRYFMISTEIRL